MASPKYSLIVPAYNEEPVIALALKSLCGQTFKDYEIIVVNNNSTDKTPEIARGYADKVIEEKSQGYHYAARAGAVKARGKYLAVCDADCVYPSNWLERVDREFQKKPRLAAIYGSLRFHDHSRIANLASGPLWNLGCRVGEAFGKPSTAGPNFVMRKDYYHKAGGYNPERYNYVGVDFELGYRISQLGKVKFCPGIFVYSSSRRFRKYGTFKTFTTLTGSTLRWWLNRPQKLTYEDYNQINALNH